MKPQAIAAVLLSVGLLSGCAGAAINATTFAVKAGPRTELKPLAEAGDSAAQYELGKSYCCMGPGFSAKRATEWLCKAAHQGNTDAMYELGRIYLGEVSRTPAPMQKVMRTVTARESDPHAHVWLKLAADAGDKEAAKKLARLEKSMSDADLIQAAEMAPGWQAMACEYKAVFADAGEDELGTGVD